MTATALLSADAGPEQDLAGLPVERLEAEIVGWNAQLSAAICRTKASTGELEFLRPDGSPIRLPSAAGIPLPHLPIPLAPDAGTCLWTGESLDLHEAVDCLLDFRAIS